MTTGAPALWTGLLALTLVGSTQAMLESRLGGQAYYDTAANLTWLANANLADTTMKLVDYGVRAR